MAYKKYIKRGNKKNKFPFVGLIIIIILISLFLFFSNKFNLTGNVILGDVGGTFFEGFESGSFSANNWILSAVSGANNWTVSTTNPGNGTYHAQSQPMSTTEPASVLELPISTLGYINVSFKYKRKLVGLDIADEFKAKWYNGTGWTTIEETLSASADDAAYVFKNFVLSSAANNNANFKIKFECTAGAVSEFCRVDDVIIEGIMTDTTPPSSVTNLVNQSATATSIYWNWTNPSDADFNQAIVYLDGVWKINTSNNFYNVTGLTAGTSYTIKVHTKDTSGNVNNTDVNSIASASTLDTTPPTITINSPTNKTYATTSINLSVSANEVINTWKYTLNSGATNTTFTPNTTITVSEGSNSLTVYANDSSNNVGSSNVNFSIDITSLGVTINSPTATIYTTSIIEFNITANEDADRAWFTIDGGTTNYTMTNNANGNFNYTLANFANGDYISKFYANDSLGNLNNTESVNFTISIPEIFSDNGDGGGGGGRGGSRSSSEKSNLSVTEVPANNKISNIQNFSNNLLNEQFEISLIDVSRRKGFVDVEYSVKNLANEDREVKLYFSIFDSNENLNSEIEESHFIQANLEKTFGVTIPIDNNLNEEIILIVDFEKYSSFVSEDAPIRRSISGFSILNSEKNKNNLFVIVLVLLFFIFILLALYKMIKNKKRGFFFKMARTGNSCRCF
ncbi:MAG: hypothetical protein Q8O84_03385 [Nanoarchaeota archaeon]|nr:hypothetical protein [Nanoarchaeota archaeon]